MTNVNTKTNTEIKTVLMDEIALNIITGEQVDFESEDEKSTTFWNGANVQANVARRMYFDLYQNGRLGDIAEYITEHIANDDKNIKVVTFVIDYNKLSKEFIDEMEEKFPNSGLKTAGERGGCIYSGATGLVCFAFRSYRDWYGSVGSTFEHPFVQGFYPATVSEFADIRKTQGAVASAIAVVKTCWGEEGACYRQTTEEYEDAINEIEEEANAYFEELEDADADTDSDNDDRVPF